MQRYSFQPVFTCDNLPHPEGVVPSAETLAAVVFRRPAFAAARLRCRTDAPPMFVLEARRLAPYANEVGRFDNRSCVRLPDAEGFRALGIGRILYVRQQGGDLVEPDDLNTLFLRLATAGIEVRYAALDGLPRPADPGPEPSSRPATTTHPWLWTHYGWYRPATAPEPAPLSAPARYRTVPRLTRFDAATGLDGGQRSRTQVLERLSSAPPPSRPSGSSGGSWFRSFGHSSG
jgi:hypothetical protein